MGPGCCIAGPTTIDRIPRSRCRKPASHAALPHLRDGSGPGAGASQTPTVSGSSSAVAKKPRSRVDGDCDARLTGRVQLVDPATQIVGNRGNVLVREVAAVDSEPAVGGHDVNALPADDGADVPASPGRSSGCGRCEALPVVGDDRQDLTRDGDRAAPVLGAPGWRPCPVIAMSILAVPPGVHGTQPVGSATMHPTTSASAPRCGDVLPMRPGRRPPRRRCTRIRRGRPTRCRPMHTSRRSQPGRPSYRWRRVR